MQQYILKALLIISFLLNPSVYLFAHDKNLKDSIVLVHGFSGWGRDEMQGKYRYWGGFNDLQEELVRAGYPTVTAAVGPISSTWDRAIELYAQLSGTCVDYGAAHSIRHGHSRYGRCYPKLVSKFNQNNRVHLIGHSQGAPTIYMLAHLLKYGSKEEMLATGAMTNPLFHGGKDWIRSVTSVSGALNGTTLSNSLDPIKELIVNITVAVASISGGLNQQNIIYDFKLDQWGLKKQINESFKEYRRRILASSLWMHSKDISAYTLSTYGAAEENRWLRPSPDVYYMSFSNSTTHKGLLSNNHYPIPFTTKALLLSNALLIGTSPKHDYQWRENDGVVNTHSMIAPLNQPWRHDRDQTKKGIWNFIGHTNNQDHLDTVGLLNLNILDFYKLKEFYLTHAKKIYSLK
ncbi:lipase [Gammaproteobacteria bacterium]|nr:lipase [Gammaproteobacteria bacterium]